MHSGTKPERRNGMSKWECPCGYVYDPEIGDPDNGVEPGTPWEQGPEDWVCPVCGAEKEFFEKMD
jgi:rubredoxin